MRHFVLVYLNSGNGHRSQAMVLKEALEEANPDVKVTLLNGFGKHNFICRMLFESGYSFSSNYLEGLWGLTYDLGGFRWFLALSIRLIMLVCTPYLRKQLKKLNPTDVVSFHFAITLPVRRALLRNGQFPNISVVACDPFTAPKSWFYDKRDDFVIYSEEAKKIAMDFRVPEERLHILPFLLNKRFRERPSKEQIASLRSEFGFDLNKPVVLLAGGGEGLPGAEKIVELCAKNNADFAVAVVCGRNKALQIQLELVKKNHPQLDLHVYGFVNFMDSLVKLCDIAVTKGGPASVLEVLASGKPLIISHYIYNQELGNMRYAVRNGAGFFIQKPEDIYAKLEELLSDSSLVERLKSNVESLIGQGEGLDVSRTARFLLDKPVR